MINEMIICSSPLQPRDLCDLVIQCHPLVKQLNELLVIESTPEVQCQQLELLQCPHPGTQDSNTCSWKGDREQSLCVFLKAVELIAIFM